jgi:hypothetical protein
MKQIAIDYVTEETTKIECDFTVSKLATYFSEVFFSNYNQIPEDNELIRSASSLNRDLLEWGFNFDPNTKRPYFEGHERSDVLIEREKFINHFLDRKEHYYTVDESIVPKWIEPVEKPCVLIFHDESTYRSNEQSSKRWLLKNHEPFLNVRSRTNQTHAKMCSLIRESREHFIDINLYIKLTRRFWRVLSAYKNGNSYQEVNSTYFSWKSKGNNKNHTIISNTNL